MLVLVYIILLHNILSLQVKTGPFYEHSNTLWSISAVSDWTKVNSGLLKMYKAEVKMMTSFTFISINIIKHFSIHEYYILITLVY